MKAKAKSKAVKGNKEKRLDVAKVNSLLLQQNQNIQEISHLEEAIRDLEKPIQKLRDQVHTLRKNTRLFETDDAKMIKVLRSEHKLSNLEIQTYFQGAKEYDFWGSLVNRSVPTLSKIHGNTHWADKGAK